MKLPFLRPLLGLLVVTSAMAQVEIPANPNVSPKKFTTRAVGGGVNPGVSLDPAKLANPNVRYITHIVLYDNRFWTNTEGKPLEAKLIAFEDLVAEVPTDSTEPTVPPPPANPTVIRDGKVRLLVNKKPVELALNRLSQQDQEFIEQIKVAVAKKAGK